MTARHVVTDESGDLRTDLEQGWLQKEYRLGSVALVGCQWPELGFEDAASDIAILRINLDRNQTKEWLRDRDGFPFVEPSSRALGEAEPVYAFGYPLSKSDVRVGPEVIVGTQSLHPRVTSAIVSSTFEASRPVQSSADPVTYVLEKALNYGNSGGPILSAETGLVHAICTPFQPLRVPQPHLRDASGNPLVVLIPSLYGVVSSIGNPGARSFLEQSGVAFSDH